MVKDGLHGSWDIPGRGTPYGKMRPCEITGQVQATPGKSVFLESTVEEEGQ